MINTLLAACTRSAPPAPPLRELAVEISGCAAFTAARGCELEPDASARVLVHSLDPIALDPTSVTAEQVATFDDAVLYRLAIPSDIHRVRIVTRGPAGEATAVLVVNRTDPPAWLGSGRGFAGVGDSDAAVALYAEHRKSADSAEAAAAAGQAARVELAGGNIDASVSWFHDAIALDRASARLSDAVDDTLALAFALSARSHRYEEARAALETVDALAAGYADGLARAPYYWGYLHSETGDRRAALRELGEAERRATRLGLTHLARNARTMMAVQLELIGRLDESIAARRAIDRDADIDACDRLTLRGGIGFALLLSVVQGAERSRLQEASDVLASGRADATCKEPFVRAMVLSNSAFAALLSGRLDEAAASLDAARALVPEPTLTESFFRLDVEGRIALGRGAATRALAVYDEMDRRARAALVNEYEWAAQIGRGAALEALKRKGDALDAYARSEDLLDDESLAIPIGEGRARFLVERGRGASAAIDLLVASGKAGEALGWARRARSRALAGVEIASRLGRLPPDARSRWDAAVAVYAQQRSALDDEAAADWKLLDAELQPAREKRAERERALKNSLEALLGVLAIERGQPATSRRAPAPGELLLLYSPSPRGWTGFASDAASTLAFSVPRFAASTPPEELALRLLVPAHAQLDRSTRVRVLLPGDLANVDVHALPWRASPLLARLPVEYSLDLGDAAQTANASRALVVGDPQRNLPAARREALAVADALSTLAFEHVDLLTEQTATHAAVIASLDSASLFHYAGHASYEGEDGWDSALPLAGGGQLLVSDIVALPHPPAHVVLSGCSAAKTAHESPGDTLGVAQAFLVAGSQTVIAPTRRVSDTLSAQFAEELYAALRDNSSHDEARALQTALLRLRDRDPNADWANFRVLRR